TRATAPPPRATSATAPPPRHRATAPPAPPASMHHFSVATNLTLARPQNVNAGSLGSGPSFLTLAPRRDTSAPKRALGAIASHHGARQRRPPRQAPFAPPGLSVQAEVPEVRRAAAGAHRRGQGAAGGVRPRRADLVVPVAQGDPVGSRRGLPLHRA